jgi:hypothetical protein
MGDAKLSKYNAILTAQVDEGSSINKGQSPEKQTQDLFMAGTKKGSCLVFLEFCRWLDCVSSDGKGPGRSLNDC